MCLLHAVSVVVTAVQCTEIAACLRWKTTNRNKGGNEEREEREKIRDGVKEKAGKKKN